MNESNIQQNTGNPKDEIDIFEFSSRMWRAFMRFLVGVGNFILAVIVFLIRKSLWIASFTFAGMLMGALLFSVQRTVYVSSLEGVTGGVDNSIVIEHVNLLDQVKGNKELLASILGLSIEQAEDIHGIKAFYGIDINGDGRHDFVDFKEAYNPKDTMQYRVPGFVHVRVLLYDESALPAVRESLLRYINYNAYIRTLHHIDSLQSRTLIAELVNEISKIDTLQRARIQKELAQQDRGGETVFVLNNEPEVRLFYQDVLLLFNQKLALERNLELYKEPILIVQDFASLEQEHRSLLKYVVILGVLMGVLGLFCSLFWQYRKRIWEIIREDAKN